MSAKGEIAVFKGGGTQLVIIPLFVFKDAAQEAQSKNINSKERASSSSSNLFEDNDVLNLVYQYLRGDSYSKKYK
ncbi:hypothetical protein Tco_1018061 [Tanacetum coccineum]|uniref:Uncharacterized protein n=1 Tax=Tanacetum coccineum TaxID=301880 RepID=A0ABQ5FT89_9ASTR